MKGFFITEEQYNKMVESYDKVAAELDQIKKQEKKEYTVSNLDKIREYVEELSFLVDTLYVFVDGIKEEKAQNGLYGLEEVFREIIVQLETLLSKREV